jgi:hypothetical protein
MKAVIQIPGTKLFLTPQGTWTQNLNDALEFLDDVRARDYAFFHEIDASVAAVSCERSPTATSGRNTNDAF